MLGPRPPHVVDSGSALVCRANDHQILLTAMNADARAFLLGQAIKWAISVKGLRSPTATLDDAAVADVYGENVLAWEVMVTSTDLSSPVTVEVAIDPDGYVGVGLLSNPRGPNY